MIGPISNYTEFLIKSSNMDKRYYHCKIDCNDDEKMINTITRSIREVESLASFKLGKLYCGKYNGFAWAVHM